ncbi:aspartate/glutamate racemase family protein [Virgibacillus oceani]|uniref:Aspartate racemase n=1 Tax=Virgibacillus oceani TaxID=1479511 RepID=A0A917M7I4_9BACI|nr:amino acid racemase [Virgibacillus oceani]GGG82432.1 aspartate racemase [Virgibacillus oceani]
MEKKSLGVLGGMGPMATSVFFEHVIENTVAASDQDHINMVILNHATLPDRTDVILNNIGDTFLEPIKKDIQTLETIGVENIAIPCNTSHYFYDEMQKSTDINIINMVGETINEIAGKYGENSKIGLLATNGTVESGIYHNECAKYNMEMYTPNDTIQQKVMDIIYGIKSGTDVSVGAFEMIIEELISKEKCNCVILACTELSTIKLREDSRKYSVDAMQVLVERSIKLSGGTLKAR